MFIRIIACFDHFSQSESKTKFFIKIIVKIKYGIFTILETSQSSRKRRITRIGTHVFSLGRMIFARRESRVRMFFLVGTR